MFKILLFLGFWGHRKMLLESSPELTRGDENSQQNYWIKKKIASKIFWVWLKYCRFFDFEFIEKCYSSFSHNSSGGTRTLNSTVAFNKKTPVEIFWVCLKLCSFIDFEFIEKFYYTLLQNSSGGDQNSQQYFWI